MNIDLRLHGIDYAILTLYFVFVLGIGFALKRTMKGSPLGRGGEEGQELEFGEKGVEVRGHFGETRQQWSAGGSD